MATAHESGLTNSLRPQVSGDATNERGWVMDMFALIYRRWRDQPTAVTLPLGMIFLGLSAMILGDHVSRAFTEIGGGSMIRVMGSAMFVGGLLVGASILREDVFLEVMGLALTAFGATFFGIGVILGLGLQGLIAGGENLLIALAFFGRIAMISRRGHAAAIRNSERQ